MLDNIRIERLKNPSLKGKKYMIATQDKDLRNRIGDIPGVPIIYLNKVTLVLEQPSTASKEFNQASELIKEALNDDEQSLIDTISSPHKKRKISSVSSKIMNNSQSSKNDKPIPMDNYILRKLKKAKTSGTNPLSNKPKSKDSNTSKKRKSNQFRGH